MGTYGNLADDLVRDLFYALRTFRRAPLVAFTIVSTVALGLGLVTVAFTVLNALLFRVDAVPDVQQMFGVERPRTSDGVSTMFFGLVPALQATRIEPIRTIRGEVVPLIGDARPGRARNVLIAPQVSASALLLICAAVFLRSAFVSSTFDPGMRTSDTVVVQIATEPMRTAIVQALTAIRKWRGRSSSIA